MHPRKATRQLDLPLPRRDLHRRRRHYRISSSNILRWKPKRRLWIRSRPLVSPTGRLLGKQMTHPSGIREQLPRTFAPNHPRSGLKRGRYPRARSPVKVAPVYLARRRSRGKVVPKQQSLPVLSPLASFSRRNLQLVLLPPLLSPPV